jgi:hypothetical protein
MKLPPFGKHLKHLIENNIPLSKPVVMLFIGQNSWKVTKYYQTWWSESLCLPPNSDPQFYTWPVKNCDILISDTSNIKNYCDISYVEKIVIALFRDGAKKVDFLPPNFSQNFESFTFYKEKMI